MKLRENFQSDCFVYCQQILKFVKYFLIKAHHAQDKLEKLEAFVQQQRWDKVKDKVFFNRDERERKSELKLEGVGSKQNNEQTNNIASMIVLG